jgi:predicted 3-demethylubiquinone-9 3-methyltransferase (glyoxalase superfamily)
MSTKIESKSEKISQKIVPFLWFDNNAEEAVNFYTSCFENSKIESKSYYDEAAAKASGQAKDTLMTASFRLNGQEFIALNGGPVFKFTPAISFFVNCKTEKGTDELWKKFSNGGTVLMELKAYPFSKKFGWIQDKFGLSWQLNFTGSEQKISPLLMFTGAQHGKAEEAMNFYTSLFKDAAIKQVFRYEAGEPGEQGKVKHATFSLAGENFMAMDSNIEHAFSFTPAVSFFVYCETQKEIDFFWEKLTQDGKEVECGWLEDKFGISWQIVPTVMFKLLNNPDHERAKRAMQAMLKMKKLDIATLERA